MIRRSLIVCIFFLCTQLAGAQNLPIFKPYSIKGLPPKSVINSVYHDKMGFLWFGGLTGLYRYDGNMLARFQHTVGDSTSLPHNYIVDFYEDAAGNFVCGSLGGGIFILDKKTGKIINTPGLEGLPEAKEGGVLRMITGSSFSSSVWCGTSSGTLIKYDPGTRNFERVFSMSPDINLTARRPLYAVLETEKDKLLVATYRGLYFLDVATKKTIPFNSLNEAFKKLDSAEIHSLFMDKQSRIWIGYKGGVMVVDNKNFNPVPSFFKDTHPPLANYTVKAITQLQNGQVLLGTNNGVFSWSESDPELKSLAGEINGPYPLPKDVNSFYTDRGGNMWVATEGQGLFLLNKNYDFFKTVPGLKQMINAGRMEAIMEDKTGNWWLGHDNGLAIYKPGTKSPETIQLNENNRAGVNSIFEDNKGGIWIGTRGSGLYHLSNPQNLINQERFPAAVINEQTLEFGLIMSICQDRFDNIWLGTYTNGVFIFDPRTNKFARPGGDPGDAKGFSVSQVMKDKKGVIWVSTLNKGLNKFVPDKDDPAKGKFINYTTVASDTNSLSFNITLGMKEDKEGNIWIATVSGGLNKFDPVNNKFTRFSTDNGLPSNLIYRIEEDKNDNIWVSTDDGLAMLGKNGGSPVSYKEEDGLPTRSFTFLASYTMRDGTIAFATIDGDVVYFQPGEAEKNTQPAAIIDFKLFNRALTAGENKVFNPPVYMADAFHLKYNQSVFTLEFSNFDLVNPDNYSFAYKMDGIDKDWNYISNRKSATYTNLSPGKYLFHLKAANHSGVWSDKETTCWIIVSPPWWRTWWAYALYALLLILGITGVIRYRSRQLRKENLRLEQKVGLRTRELNQSLEELKATQTQLIQSEKMASLGELTAGIAHEIQNPLNFVNNFSEVNTELIEEMKAELKAGNNEEAIAIANDISDNEQKINHHGKRADAIVKGMLQHSRSSSGVKEPADINALADEYLRLAYHGLRAKDKSFNATMKTDFDETIGNINIIPQDIGRVILNLITNAFYAVTDKKRQLGETFEPIVSVSTKKVNGKVEIRVKDNGNGIPKKVLDKIFQPFFTTKPTGQGTGLGLSLSYDIIKSHGGELRVETKEAEFAEFIIHLPVKDHSVNTSA